PGARENAVDRVADAAVDAEREAVARGIDGIDHRIDRIGLEAQHMQDRTEHFAGEARQRVDLDDMRPEEGAGCTVGWRIAAAEEAPAGGGDRLDMADQ